MFGSMRFLERLLALALVILPAFVAVPAAFAQTPAVPALDRAWGAAEYRDLNELIKSGKAPLPTLTDPATRPVFERVVNLRNLDVAANKSLPVGARLQEMLGVLDGTRTLLVAYVTQAQAGKPHERELAKMQVFMLAVATASLNVANEFLPTIPKDDRYQTRMAGFEQMRQGFRTMVGGVVQSVAETTFYSKESTIELVQGIIAYLPSMQQVLSDQDRQDYAKRIGDQLAATTDPDLKAALGRLQAALAKAN
jgi:hypothetical protein